MPYLTRLAEFDLYVGGGDTAGALLSKRSNLEWKQRQVNDKSIVLGRGTMTFEKILRLIV